MKIRDMHEQRMEPQKDDATMGGIWSVAVERTRAPLEGPWGL